MEAQRQLVEMDEDFVGEAAHRVHRHRREQGVAPLLGQRHQNAHQAVERGERQRPGERAHRRRAGAADGGRERVGRPFQRVGRGDGHQLRGDHQHHRQAGARLQVGAVARPQVRPQAAHRARQGALGFAAPARGEETGGLWLVHEVPRRNPPRYRGARPRKHPRRRTTARVAAAAARTAAAAAGFLRDDSCLDAEGPTIFATST